MSLYKSLARTQSASCFNVISHGITDIGHVRTKNEDSILLLPEESSWVVADGMGGHQSGDFASQTITQNMGLFEQQPTLEDSILLMEENLINSNAIIRKKALKLGRNTTIGSTVVSCHIWGKFMFTFWAGDSRLYLHRDDQLIRLTEDHSYVEELVKMGKIEAKDAELHPASNVVLKAVGIDDDFRVDFSYFEMQDDDIYVVCSDGLYKDLSESKISDVIQANRDDLPLLNQSLLSSSLDAGGSDNISIITIKVTQ
ncbi:MAG: protein phosphatase [Gammaproteobacteria bacterium]